MKIVINIEKDDEDTEYELWPDWEWIKKEETEVEINIKK